MTRFLMSSARALALASVLPAAAATITSDRSGVTMAKSGREITKADAKCFAASCLGINERLCYVNDFNANGGADWTAGTNALVLNARASCINGSGMYDPSFAPFLYPVHGGDPARLVPLAMRDAFRSDVKNFFTATTYPTGSDWMWLGIADDSTLSISANGITVHTLGGRALGDLFDAYHWEDYRWFTAQTYLDDVYEYAYNQANAPDMTWTNTTITVLSTNGWTCTYPEMLTNYTTRCLHEDWRWACVNAFAPFQNIWMKYNASPFKATERKWKVTVTAQVNISSVQDPQTGELTVTMTPISQSAVTNITYDTARSFMNENGVTLSNTTYLDNSQSSGGVISIPWHVWGWFMGTSGHITPIGRLYPSDASGFSYEVGGYEMYLRDENTDERTSFYETTATMTWTSKSQDFSTVEPSAKTLFNCDAEANMNVYRVLRCVGHANGASTATNIYHNLASPYARTIAAEGGWYNAFRATDITDAASAECANLTAQHDFSPAFTLTAKTETYPRSPRYAVAWLINGSITNRAGFTYIDTTDPLSITNNPTPVLYPTLEEMFSESAGWTSYTQSIPTPTTPERTGDFASRDAEYTFYTFYFGAFYGWAKNVKWSH